MADIEIFLICTPNPLPEKEVSAIAQILSPWGYDVLAQEKADMGSLPTPHKNILAIAAQDLQPQIKDGINQRIFKAARSLGRKLKNSQAHILTPQDHKTLFPKIFAENIKEEAARNVAAFQPPYPSVRLLSNHASRSRVDVINYKGGLAVCKTFRPSAMPYLEREKKGRELGLPEVAPILETRDNYFIMPYYEDIWQWDARSASLYPVDKARTCMEFLRRLHEKGYALVDAHPGTFIFSRDGQAHIADMEYLLATPSEGPFDESFDIAGPPPSYNGYLPAGRAVTYMNAWQPVLGLSLDDLFHASETQIYLLRLGHLICRRWPKWCLERIKKVTKRKSHPPIRKGYLIHYGQRLSFLPPGGI